MKMGMKILAAAVLPLGLAACGGSTTPRPRYDEAFVDTLIRCLQDEDARTRFGAIRALGRLPGSVAQKAIPAVRCLLHDANPQVREEAARVVKKLDPSFDVLVLADRTPRSMP